MHVFDIFAQQHPTAVRRILNAAHLYVLTLPVATVLAALTDHTVLTVIGVVALIGLYATGYATAAWRGRDQVAAARRDPLTGLPNRAVADDMLADATRSGTPVTVALLDVDGLHMINGSLGYAAGDQYLITVARRLEHAVPTGGVLVRQGGDELTIVAPGTDPQQLATDIGAALAGPAVIAGYRIQPRASVGIAATDTLAGPADANHTRARADSALYTAKLEGGNQIRIYLPGRDPEPGPDGTRPLLRRRDVNPLAAGVAWQPAPGDDLIPLLLSVADTHTLHDGLITARDMCGRSATAAPSTDPGWMSVEPDPGGYPEFAEQRARYARLVEHLTPIIDATAAVERTGPTSAGRPSVASVVLVGISAQFTPLDLEALVITAAEAVHGQPEDLSSRQHDLAARAYALLQDAVDD